MLAESIEYLHITSLALWFGGLFGYVLIVWPSIIRTQNPGFPRQILSAIAMRTAPWIYLAMGSALVTLVFYFWYGADAYSLKHRMSYSLVLVLLIANNVYGSAISWPRIMLSPDNHAKQSWQWFYRRMAISLVAGLSLLSIAIVMT